MPTKISALTTASTLTGAETLPLVQSSVTKKSLLSVIADYVSGIATSFLQAGAGAVARTPQFKMRDTFSVKDFGAIGDGVADDTAAINTAITAAPSGSEVFFPAGTYLVSTSVLINKKVKLRGAGAIGESGGVSTTTGTIIKGTGITIIRATEPFVLEDVCISDPTGNAATIGLDVNDGATGVANWSLSRVFISGTASKLGTGVRTVFGLKGTLMGCVIEGWSNGVDETASGASFSNANAFIGCKIRYNTIGLRTDSDTTFINSSTIEGNTIGVDNTAGKVSIAQCHLENNIAPAINVRVSGGNLYSFGNGYFGTAANLDISITGGAGTHGSFGDTINAGITHAGSGVFSLYNSVNGSPAVAGAGVIYQVSGNGFKGLLNGASQALGFSSYAFISTSLAYLNTGGAAQIGGSGGTQFVDGGVTVKASIGTSGQFFPQQTTSGIYSGPGTPEAAVTAAVGSTYMRTNGGAGTGFYVKESGTGNTGWVAK